MRFRTGKNGFTLVELMVVVVIIAISTAVMVGSMHGTFEETLLRANARKIMDACEAASNRAISARDAQLLRFDSAGGRFAIVSRHPNAEASPGEIDTAGAAGELDDRIQLVIHEPQDTGEEQEALPVEEERQRKAQADVMTFYPDGTCDAREFSLRDRAGVELVLRINPITSRVRVLEMAAR